MQLISDFFFQGGEPSVSTVCKLLMYQPTIKKTKGGLTGILSQGSDFISLNLVLLSNREKNDDVPHHL